MLDNKQLYIYIQYIRIQDDIHATTCPYAPRGIPR